MQAVPVLLMTHDDAVWQHWRQLDDSQWRPARSQSLQDLARWREQGRGLVVLDSALPRLPAWTDPAWAAYLAGLKVVVASTRPDDDQAARALSAGAVGYVHAYLAPAALGDVLLHVNAGNVWMGRTLVQRILRLIDSRLPQVGLWSEGLTERERDVARRAAVGETNQEIAEALGISERTVKAHLSASFEKLGVSDRLGLALRVHGIGNTTADTSAV
jgi:DNA-binding NarL/FixJ family response regulator